MKAYRLFWLLAAMQVCLSALAQQEWKVESEDPSATVAWKNGVCDIVAPKGLTLWYTHRMEGNTVIEYEAAIVGDKNINRISDLNCFWQADQCGGYGGRFVDNYALSLYYMGYGGNHNTTTRFRRYNGDVRGVADEAYRPRILKEYTDERHLLKADHWYKIRLEQVDGRVRYYIDGELLVDYLDPQPLTGGYFGFRTTLAHARLRNFRYTCTNPDAQPVLIRNIFPGKTTASAATFGVPFGRGEVASADFKLVTTTGKELALETERLATWDDGSIKWQAFTTIVPGGCDSLLLYKQSGNALALTADNGEADVPPFYVTLNHETTPILTHDIESKGSIRTVHRYTGRNFVIRAYTYKGSREIKFVHTLIVDSLLNQRGLNELSIHFRVPMHGRAYERFVEFDQRRLSVQPLVARRPIDLRRNDDMTRQILESIAQWDGFRLSQLSPNGYSIRKRATSRSPWIGTMEGTRSSGYVVVGDSTSQTAFLLKDFWESYPSTLQVDDARSDTATVSICLYSPEAEPYSFEHYDTIPHGLDAAYEDVQPGMSTAWGIGRTSTIYIYDRPSTQEIADALHGETVFLPTPDYLHRKRAFGIWSLPTQETSRDSLVESTLTGIMDFYQQ